MNQVIKTEPILTLFETQRQRLRMPMPVLARRSGVSAATLHRIFSGKAHAASLANVAAVAGALGLGITFELQADAEELRDQQARRKAEQLVRLVQGSSGLEGQAVDEETVHGMVQKTMHELLAGSGSKLWSE